MTVCRDWCDIIQGHSLFRTIFIYHKEQLDQLLEKVKRNAILGEKVERLTLQLHLHLKKNYSAKIIEHFPNLCDLALINLTDYKMGSKTIRPRPTHPWCKKMEKVVENKSDSNTKTILLSGPCKHLTYISVWGDNEPVRGLIEAIVSAPSLKTLHLRNYMTSFEDLELLPNVAPLLNSLLLDHIRFIPCPHLLDIEPATLMKSVRCRHSDFSSIRSINVHLPYFTQKYTHLEDFAFEIELYETRQDLWTRDTDKIASYIKQMGPRLKTSSLKLIEIVRLLLITEDHFHCQGLIFPICNHKL